MDYEKLYNEALKRAKGICNVPDQDDITIARMEYLFPELKESDDEKIRKHLISLVKNWDKDGIFSKYTSDANDIKQILAWLEKQGEKKPTDKREPKFHEGDWIACKELNTAKIINIYNNRYEVELIDGSKCFPRIDYVDRNFHLWTIDDAKDGDVLVYNNGATEIILLFEKWIDGVGGGAYSYVHIFDNGNEILFNDYSDCGKNAHPATKEQRTLLFQKIEEADYQWDVEKKELKKIEDEIEIPFGAKDSELQEATYYIPKGFHAEIDDDKVVIKKGEKPTTWSEEDEEILKNLIDYFSLDDGLRLPTEETIDWLKSLKERIS